MFDQYEPIVKTTISFLKRINVKVNDSTVNETLQNHPDWPSLLCMSDSLNKWNVPNGVGRLDMDDIAQLPTPFIASFNNRETPLAIVTNINDGSIELSKRDHRATITIPLKDFLKSWQGIYLIAEPNLHSGEPDYIANKQKTFYNSLLPIAAISILLFFSLYLLNHLISNALVSPIGIYIQYFILLVGIIVTTALLWYEIDKNNPLLNKVCTGISKGNCSAILTGKQAKVFRWLSWSEVGFFYFSGTMLILLFGGNTLQNTIALIAWLNILALPYTIFSVYYQWRIAKQWCVLCLAVQTLLLFGVANVTTNSFLFPFPYLSITFIVKIILLYSLPLLIWYVIKPRILKLQEAKNTKREYLRIKFNTEIFDALLKKQKAVVTTSEGLGIDIGNPDATNTIIKVCNPYCGPCAKAHPKIEALLEHNKNVKAKIIFTTPNNESNPALKPVKHLLAIAAEGSVEKTRQALDDWYLPRTKDYQVFSTKYKMNGELTKQEEKVEAMVKWCNTNDITYTPTIFINGQQLPDAYSIEDLQYFLLE